MSVSAVTLRMLMDVGLQGDALLAVVESIDRDNAKPARSSGAERTRRYRDKKAGNVTSDVTVTRDGDVTSAKDVSPTPPSENPSPPKGTLKGPQKVPHPSNPDVLEKPTPEVAKPLSGWVAEIWEITPRPGRERSGRPALENALRAAMRRGADPAAIKRGLIGYYGSADAAKGGGEYAKGVHSALSTGRWEAFAEEDLAPPDENLDPWPRRLRGWKANDYWNSEWGPKPGKPGYSGPETEARAA